MIKIIARGRWLQTPEVHCELLSKNLSVFLFFAPKNDWAPPPRFRRCHDAHTHVVSGDLAVRLTFSVLSSSLSVTQLCNLWNGTARCGVVWWKFGVPFPRQQWTGSILRDQVGVTESSQSGFLESQWTMPRVEPNISVNVNAVVSRECTLEDLHGQPSCPSGLWFPGMRPLCGAKHTLPWSFCGIS